MKSLHCFTASLLLTVFHAAAQGPLTPPGAPGPTMKTLDQIEPGKPVQSLATAPPYLITAPGYYYLTGNITVASGDAVNILADDVHLDLRGFTINSTRTGSGAGNAITLTARNRLTVENGSITSGSTQLPAGEWAPAGFNRGIYSPSFSTQSIARNLHFTGIRGDAIYFDAQGIVEHCTVNQCGTGIIAEQVSHCSVSAFDSAIQAETVSDCSAKTFNINNVGPGAPCLEAVTVTNCYSSSNYHTAIKATTATGCNGTSGGIGLDVKHVSNCQGTGGTFGIIGETVENSTGTCTGFGTGIQAEMISNSKGTSDGVGIRSFAIVSNCYGKSNNNFGFPPAGVQQIGIWVDGTATSCRGDHYTTVGTAIRADIAIGCTRAQGVITANSKQLGTP